MTECVAITRDGRGDLWKFGSFSEADQHPIVQYGDPIIPDPKFVAKRVPLARLPALMRRVGRPELAERAETILNSQRSHRAKLETLETSSKVFFDALVLVASPPPEDPAQIVNLIRRDRILSVKESKMSEETPTAVDTSAAPVADKPKKEKAPKAPKAPKEPKEPKEAKPRYAEGSTITLLKNGEGVQYGKDNNPKRPGSASYDRFALYTDGMLLSDAVKAGVTTADIAWDVSKGFIEVVPPAAG
jgi:hypothetical protein